MKTHITLLIIAALLLMNDSYAGKADATVGFSVRHETAEFGDISGLSIYGQFVNGQGLGFQIGTTLNNAEIIDFDGYVENYASWEGYGRMGLFSDVSLYLEAGLDIGEMLTIDDRYDDYYYYHRYEPRNEVDYFFGAGLGIQSDHLSISVFSRYRFIDGVYLTDNQGWFSGVELQFYF